MQRNVCHNFYKWLDAINLATVPCWQCRTNKESWLIRSDFKDRWQSSRLKIEWFLYPRTTSGRLVANTDNGNPCGPRAHLEINLRELRPNNGFSWWTRFITLHKILLLLGKRYQWMKNKRGHSAGGFSFGIVFRLYFWTGNRVKWFMWIHS